MIGGGSAPLSFALALAMLAAFALTAGGIFLLVKRRDRQRGLLMIGAGAVLVMNVLIWAWPGPAIP